MTRSRNSRKGTRHSRYRHGCDCWLCSPRDRVRAYKKRKDRIARQAPKEEA